MALNKTRFPTGTDPVSAVMAAARATQAQRSAMARACPGLSLTWRLDAAGQPVMDWLVVSRPVPANDLAANDSNPEGRTRRIR